MRDGGLLPAAPARAADAERTVPMLVGLNGDEASALSPHYGVRSVDGFSALLRKSYGTMASRFERFYPGRTAEERVASSKALLRERGLASLRASVSPDTLRSRPAVFAYIFTHAEPSPQSARYGAFHSAEIPYVFGTLGAAPERRFTAADRRLSRQMQSLWVNFIKTGNPNGPGLPSWPQLTPKQYRILELDERVRTRPLLSPAKLRAVDAFLAQGGQPSLF